MFKKIKISVKNQQELQILYSKVLKIEEEIPIKENDSLKISWANTSEYLEDITQLISDKFPPTYHPLKKGIKYLWARKNIIVSGKKKIGYFMDFIFLI